MTLSSNLINYLWYLALSVGAVEYADCTSAEDKSPPMEPPVCRGWRLVMPGDGILVAERPMSMEQKRHWLQHSIWSVTLHTYLYVYMFIHMECFTPRIFMCWPLPGLDERSEGPGPINRLVTSSPTIYYPPQTCN